MPDELWEAFGRAVEAAGTDRNAVVRKLISEYVREAGVELPERPPRDD